MMEDHPNRIIELVGIKRSRSLLSHIGHQMAPYSEYRVTVTHDPEVGGFACRIHARIDGRQCTGYETAKTLHASVERALRHLHADPFVHEMQRSA